MLRLTYTLLLIGLFWSLGSSLLAQTDSLKSVPDTLKFRQLLDSVFVKVDTAKGFRRLLFGQDVVWPLPQKAVRASFILPGLGQFYNKSYWKIPIVYAAIGTCVFFAVQNANQFKSYRDAYRWRLDGDSTTIDAYDPRFSARPISTENLKSLRDYYRQNRDLSILLSVIAYGLNALDAYVDAHLKHFDVSDNLSLHFQPLRYQCQNNHTFTLQTGVILQQKISKKYYY